MAYYDKLDMSCKDQWVEGSLRADVDLHDGLTNQPFQAAIAIEVSGPEPSGVRPEKFVLVRWPKEYTGMRLADGEVVALDGAGLVVGTTGGKYRLKGEWDLRGAVGGPKFRGPGWIDGFDVCRGSGSVIPQ